MTEITAESNEGSGVEFGHTPRINLSSLEHIRLEMGRVYRSMRGGLIDTRDGSRLVYSLTSIGKILEAEENSRQARELTTVEVTQSSVLDGIDLGTLSKEQLNALELAVLTIENIREGKPLPQPMLSKGEYKVLM